MTRPGDQAGAGDELFNMVNRYSGPIAVLSNTTLGGGGRLAAAIKRDSGDL